MFRRKGADAASQNKEEAKEEPAKQLLEERRSAFDKEQVLAIWKAFKEERINSGASDIEKLVLDRKVVKAGDESVRITLESQLENSILDKLEVELIRFFRKNLDNSFVQLEREVVEQVTARNLYTSKEKFEYMAKLNPVLRDMKDRLGLDFEY